MGAHADDGRAGRRAPAGLVHAGVVCGCFLLIAATVSLVGWVFVRLAPVTLAVAAALLLTALLTPVVDVLTRLRVPRVLAALMTVLLLLTALVLPLVLVGHQAATEFDDLDRRLDDGLTRLRTWIVNGPLPIDERQVDQLGRQVHQAVRAAAPGLVRGASAATEAIGAAALALLLLFFLLKDGQLMWEWILRRIPDGRRDVVLRAGVAGWHALSGYVRGTVVIAAVDALGIGAALVFIDVPFALPLTLLTFVAAFVPLVGATVAGAAAVLVTLAANNPTDALIILAAVVAVQQTEGNLLEPLVMGRAVRLHPAVILLAVAAGTLLAGVAGALVAVPTTAVVYRVTTSMVADESEPACPG